MGQRKNACRRVPVARGHRYYATCLDSGKHAAAIRDSIVEGSKAGVDGTPALFINGRFLGGNQPYAEIEKLIEDELTRVKK